MQLLSNWWKNDRGEGGGALRVQMLTRRSQIDTSRLYWATSFFPRCELARNIYICIYIMIARAGDAVGGECEVYVRLVIVRVGWVCHAGADIRCMRARRMMRGTWCCMWGCKRASACGCNSYGAAAVKSAR